METQEQYKKRQVLAQMKQAYTLLHSAKLEASALSMAADVAAADTALANAIVAVVAELDAVVEPPPPPPEEP